MEEERREFFRRVLELFLEGRLDVDRATRLLERAFQEAAGGNPDFGQFGGLIEDHLLD